MFLYDIANNIKLILSMILAYGFSVTLAGAIKAWVAKKAGDYTAEHAGFLTIDPVVHVDPIGMFVMLFTGFGWGREIPVNPYNIDAPYRDLKMLCVYYATTVAHILLTALCILGLAGLQIVAATYMIDHTIIVTLSKIFQIAAQLNIFLGMLRFIQSSVDLAFMHMIERNPASALYIHLISLIITLIILFLFGTHIQRLFTYVSYSLASGLIGLFS